MRNTVDSEIDMGDHWHVPRAEELPRGGDLCAPVPYAVKSVPLLLSSSCQFRPFISVPELVPRIALSTNIHLAVRSFNMKIGLNEIFYR